LPVFRYQGYYALKANLLQVLIKMEYLKEGSKDGYITIDREEKYITYIIANKKYRYSDPEEKVRALTYLKLIYDFKYQPERITLELTMPGRIPDTIADIIVYSDDKKTEPFLVVECKAQEVSDAAFKQAIEQGFAYSAVLKAKYLWVTSGLNDRYYNVEEFGILEREENEIPIIPIFGQKEFKEATYIKSGEGIRGLKELTEDELTRIFKKAHDSLWYGGKRNPSEAFDELNKLIFCKIYDEKITEEDGEDGEPYRFQIFPSDEGDADKLFGRIQGIYAEGRKQDPEVFKDDIRITPQELRTIVGFLAKVNLRDTDLDSKGRAFEIFLKDDIFRGKFGQYFTPRSIVKFIVDVLPIDGKSLVLDPSCDSGGFLLYALDKVREQAKVKFPRDKVKAYNYWHGFAENNLFGIEISDTIARVAKMNMIIHDDGHTNVISFDGLESLDKIHTHALKNKSRSFEKFQKDTFDFIITNPPFGSSVKASERSYLGDYDLGKKNFDWIDTFLKNLNLENLKENQQSEILFLEQYWEFLKAPDNKLNEGGVLAAVIPDSILTNSTTQYVRDWIEENYRIIAIVSLPQTAFMATGAGVKCSILFLLKYPDEQVFQNRSIKTKIQTNIFNKSDLGGELVRLLKEKDYKLKRGDGTIQKIHQELVNLIQALNNQGQVDKKMVKAFELQAKEKIEEHKKTAEFIKWKKEITSEYDERISNMYETMEDAYIEKVQGDITNYPIFMAIAEDIGYDATGRELNKNDLPIIAKELKPFIAAVKAGDESFFD
jgi:type I restriction enzyme M protein